MSFCLANQEFQINTSETFQELGNCQNFKDVTIVTEDDKNVTANQMEDNLSNVLLRQSAKIRSVNRDGMIKDTINKEV